MSKTMTADMRLDRRTLSSQIFTRLEEKVLSGEILPGTRLSEEALATAYGVSRAPVREALTQLEHSGLAVRLGPRDRMIVVPTHELIMQKYDLWWVVDVGRTYLASMSTTEAQCDALAALIERMDQAVKKKRVEEYRRLCEKFHADIRQSCDNPFVNQLGAGCDVYLTWLERLYDRNPDVSAAAVIEHRQILAAYRKRDFAALSESIRAHMLRQRDDILALFKAAVEPASALVKAG